MNITQNWCEAIDSYLAAQRAAGYPSTTQYTRRQHLQHLARHIGLEYQDIQHEQLVQWCSDQQWSPSTRRSRRTTFQGFFAWAKHTKRRKGDPARDLRRVRQPKPSPRPIPGRVYHEALMLADELERIWLELAHDLGLRRGELALVHHDDLVADLVGWSLVVHGKGAKDRLLPLTDRQAVMLLEATEDGWLCPGDDAGHISPRWLGKRVNTLLEGRWTIHACRHAAGTKFNAHGGLLVAQQLLGHASVATTEVYCALPLQALRDTVNATALATAS